ncbi:NAD(P)/FAD-dependent oxidoreductase [Paracoccus jeotgali]|uniref:NAD(P)/FAD-dependent oxidoreductase n=1 Tax=Paracoccus jeotgali TaxID=2065379 RepID=UPI0028A7395E|nr:FAD-binding oxidoreductase [Paracoccus jeotgali]
MDSADRSDRNGDEMKSDVIIIGGGIAGVSAGALIASGAQVTLLESESMIGHHTTGRSAAMFIRNYGGPAVARLNEIAEAVFENPEGITDQPLLTPRGELHVARADEAEHLDRYLRDAEGMDRVTTEEALQLCPILRPEAAVHAAIERGARAIDTDLLLQGYARMLRRKGGRIETGAPVTAITHQAGTWRVETPKGTFEAPVLVNAAGAWADQVAGLAGLAPVGLVPRRRNAAILPAPAGHDVETWPMVVNAADRWYIKPEAGKLMFSPSDAVPSDPCDAWSDDMELAEGLDRFSQDVTYEVTRVERSWAGLRSFAPDLAPVVGFDPEATGFWWLAGQGGTGIQTAPALAALSAAGVLGQPSPVSDEVLASFSPQRFRTA